MTMWNVEKSVNALWYFICIKYVLFVEQIIYFDRKIKIKLDIIIGAIFYK